MIVASAPSPMRTTLREATKLRLAPRTQRNDKHRLLEFGVGGDVDHRTVRHVRRVERQHRIVVAVMDTQKVGSALFAGEHGRQRGDGYGAVGDKLRKIGRILSVDEHDAMRFDGGERPERRRRASDCVTRGALRDGSGSAFLYQVAQIGVFPRLDAPMRQAERAEAADRVEAHGAHVRATRQLRRRRERLAEALLRLRLQYRYVHLAPPRRRICSHTRSAVDRTRRLGGCH